MGAEMLARVVLHGKPEPQGSKRIGRHKTTGKPMLLDANPHTRVWRDELTRLMLAHRPPQVLTGPVKVVLRVYLARPKSHFATGRNAGRLKETAPGFPTGKPDLDKLQRSVGDAGTGVWWIDDSQIAEWSAIKFYAGVGEPERVEVSVHRLYAPETGESEVSE